MVKEVPSSDSTITILPFDVQPERKSIKNKQKTSVSFLKSMILPLR